MYGSNIYECKDEKEKNDYEDGVERVFGHIERSNESLNTLEVQVEAMMNEYKVKLKPGTRLNSLKKIMKSYHKIY